MPCGTIERKDAVPGWVDLSWADPQLWKRDLARTLYHQLVQGWSEPESPTEYPSCGSVTVQASPPWGVSLFPLSQGERKPR